MEIRINLIRQKSERTTPRGRHLTDSTSAAEGKFRFKKVKARFTEVRKNLGLKERVAQYADYIQRQIEDALHLERGYFGAEVRYGLCLEGEIGLFVETSGGGSLCRLRGVYIEEGLIDEFYEFEDRLYSLCPALIAHEVSHDFEYGWNRYPGYYENFKDTYREGDFFQHLNDLQADKKAFGLLRGIDLEIPGQTLGNRETKIFRSYLLLCEIELERFRRYVDEKRIVEIMGERDVNEKLLLKFARNIALIKFVFDNLPLEDAGKWADAVDKHQKNVRDFLRGMGIYDERAFAETCDVFKRFLETEA
jgi:hypothetical protein